MPWGTEFLYPALHTNAYRPRDDWVLAPNLPGLQPPVVAVVVGADLSGLALPGAL